MRLQYITSDSHQAGTLFGQVVRVVSDLPPSYLFVETVVANGLLSEASGARLGALISASLSQLQNFLTPGATTDLIALLSFIAPTGGGLPKIKELISQAKTIPGSLADNEDWWRDIFTTCGVKDPAVQEHIRKKVNRELIPQDTLLDQKTASPMGSEDKPGQFGSVAAELPGVPLNANGETENGLSEPPLQIDRWKMSRIERLKALNRSLMRFSSRPIAESFFNAIAIGLLREGSVRSNLKFVASNMMRRFGAPSLANYEDDNWLRKFMNTFKKTSPVAEGFSDTRSFTTDPSFSPDKMDRASQSENNQRAAKLAVRLLFDHLNQELASRLQVAGLTIDGMHETVKLWNQLHTKYKSGSRDPQLIAKITQVYNEKLKPLILAIRPELRNDDVNEALARVRVALCD